MKKLTLLSLFLVLVTATEALASSVYKLKAINKANGPAYAAEIMTPARNKKEFAATENSPLATKTTVSVLVTPINKFMGPGELDPNILELHIADSRDRFVCSPISRLKGDASDAFYSNFSASKLKNFKRYRDNRKAGIFEFDPSCFKYGDHIHFYSEHEIEPNVYRHSTAKISERLKAAIVADFAAKSR